MTDIPKLFPTNREVEAVRARLESTDCTIEDSGVHWMIRPQSREAEERLIGALAIDPCKLKKWGVYNVAYHEIHALLEPESQG
jgi:hypothetical protein